MNERDLNVMIVKSFAAAGGFAYKIPDPPRVTLADRSFVVAKRPFDGFGIVYGRAWFWEAKFMSGFHAVTKVSEHQYTNLDLVRRAGETGTISAVLLVGCWQPRRGVLLFAFGAPRLRVYFSEHPAFGLPAGIRRETLMELADAKQCIRSSKGLFDIAELPRIVQ